MRSIPNTKRAISSFIERELNNANFIISLKNGQLAAEFGLSAADGAVQTQKLIRFIADSIQMQYQPRRSGYIGTLQLLLDLSPPTSEFSYISSKSGSEIQWLRWLLTSGARVVIADYDVEYGDFDASRSGQAIMKERSGAVWRVPLAFAGTADDNVLTRWLAENVDDLFQIMIVVFLGSFR